MAETIFFSWQLDTSSRTGRNFIERTLQRAIGILHSKADVEEAPRGIMIDRDTVGVPGSPAIVDTIFGKIDAASIFMGDVTFVALRLDGRPSPNPNVLIEYGWALKSLSNQRILTIMNTAFGEPTPESLPFDMRHLRFPIQYHLPDDATEDDVKSEREKLVKKLVPAIQTILDIPVPAAPVSSPIPFVPKPPSSSPGRYRAVGEAIGVSDERGHLAQTIEVKGPEGAVAWLRLHPQWQQDRIWGYPELKQAATEVSTSYMNPFLGGGGNRAVGHLRAPDGFGTRAMWSDNSLAIGSSLLFETGEIWGMDGFILQAHDNVMYLDEQEFGRVLECYRAVLRRLGVEGPLIWIAGFDGVRGKLLARSSISNPETGAVALVEVIQSQGLFPDEVMASQALLPFFTEVRGRCGIS